MLAHLLTAALPLLLLPAQELAENDPRASFVQALEERMRRNEFFKRSPWDRSESCPPVVLLLQRPHIRAPDHEQGLVDFYGRWLAELARVFDEQIATPAGLERSADLPYDAAVLLLSSAHYRDYRKTAPLVSRTGHYNTGLGLTVAYADLDGPGAPYERRTRVLRPFAEGLLRAHSKDGLLPPCWLLEEGLIDYLTTHVGREPSVLALHERPASEFRDLILAIRSRPTRAAYVLRIGELIELASEEAAAALVYARAKETGARASHGTLQNVTGRIAALWIQYLDAEDGANRTAFLVFLGDVMSGGDPAPAFHAAFPDLDELERGFYEWVFDEYARVNDIEGEVDRSSLDELFAAPVDEGEQAEPAFDPAVLAPDPEDVLVRHALALQSALDGDVEAALADVELLAVEEAEGAFGRRLQREAGRLRVLARVRAAYLQQLADAGGRLKLDLEGRVQSLPIERLEDGVLHFGENRAGLESLAVDSVPSHDLAVEMSDYLSGSNEAWIRYYVYVLAEDERWQRLLKDDRPAETELRDDAEEWYPGILRLGRVARALSELARGGLPQDPTEAQVVLDTAAGLAEGRELEVVEQRLDAIRIFIGHALAHFFDAAAQAAVVNGSFESLDDGRVRLAYEFDADDEALDFVRRPGYLGDWRESLVDLDRSEAESTYAVEDGVFGGVGSLCYGQRIELTAPIRLTVRIRYGSGARGGDIAFLWFGLCDDGEEAYILCGSDGGMSVSDPATRYFEHTTDDKTHFVVSGALEELVIEHSGDKVETFLNGEPRYEIDPGPRKSGAAFLMAHSNVPIEIASFEIVGHLAPGQLERLQAEWVADELARMGF